MCRAKWARFVTLRDSGREGQHRGDGTGMEVSGDALGLGTHENPSWKYERKGWKGSLALKSEGFACPRVNPFSRVRLQGTKVQRWLMMTHVDRPPTLQGF